MIPAIRKFERLSIEFPEKEIFLRLGGNCFKTTIDEESRTRYNGLSRKLFALCEPQGRFITLPISEIHENGVETADGFLVSYYHSNGTPVCLNSTKVIKILFDER